MVEFDLVVTNSVSITAVARLLCGVIRYGDVQLEKLIW